MARFGKRRPPHTAQSTIVTRWGMANTVETCHRFVGNEKVDDEEAAVLRQGLTRTDTDT